MTKNNIKITDFFQSSDFRNLSFYLYYSSFQNEKKEEIAKYIINNNGVSK